MQIPYNGSGVFTPPGTDFPAVPNTVIESAKYNNVVNDVASGLTNAITKDGQTTPTGNIPLGNNKITNLATGTVRTDAANLGNIQDGAINYVATVGGTANAITLSPLPVITAYVAGQIFSFLATAANTAATTIAVSGLAAKSVVTISGTPLLGGEIQTGIVEVEYDGTTFRLLTATAKGVEDSTAKADGITNDSTSVSNYLTSHAIRTYVLGGINLSNSQSLDFTNNIVKAAAASSFIFSMNGYASTVKNAYISDATAATIAIKFGSGGRFDRLTDVDILNAVTAIKFDPGAGSNDRAKLSNVQVETYTTDGMYVGPNVSEINSVNVYLDSGIEIANNRPKRGTNGYRHVSTGSTSAAGGHLHVNMTTINCETGFYFTDATLTSLQNCIADTTAGYGLKMDGVCTDIEISNLFVGTSMGVYIGGTSQDITINGLRTRLIGTTPPWGGANFYLTAGPYYALTIADTAKVTVDGDEWYGEKTISVASGATLVIKGGTRREWGTDLVGAASTSYMDDDKADLTESRTVFRMPYDGYLVGMQCYVDTAPTGAETFVYTARLSSVDTSLTATITGSATDKSVWAGSAIFATKGAAVTIKLVVSAGAVQARHTGHLIILGV